jgi:hypothetical protein
MTKMSSHPKAPDYSHFLPEILDGLRRVADTYLEQYNEHQAFVYFIAELYETTDEERFSFTDGPSDGGIDFLISDPPAYTIAQCKAPSVDRLMAGDGIPKFDQSALEELSMAIEILHDPSGEYELKQEIKQLRGDYQRDLRDGDITTSLTAILAVLGELTEPARRTFASLKKSYAKDEVILKMVEWKDIYHSLHALETPADIDFDIRVHFDNEADLLAHSNYVYMLANAYDFYQAFREHEWNLFEWNVRYQIHRSPINKRIVGTLRRARGRRYFHHYNNGLLITCKGYKKDLTRKRLTLTGPQIINGCQTVRAICEAYESLTPSEQRQFREETRVQVKVIKTTDPEFIAELVISTNDQNPMKPRNLKSNTSEQRSIQKSFRGLPHRWFYQRKDGEFKSLISTSSKVRWFRKSDYSAGHRRYRLLDNQDLAKAWYAFTGHSHRALRGGIDYFEDEPDGVYRRVFRSFPSPAFWSTFQAPTFTLDEGLFEAGIPSAYQFLLAAGVGEYVDSRRVSFRVNRQEAIRRGLNNGELKGDEDTVNRKNTRREIDEYLSSDVDYNLNIMINNMREVMIELMAFILVNKFGPVDAQTAQTLIHAFPGEECFINSGFYDLDDIQLTQTGQDLFGPSYEFLRDCIKQYYFEFQAEIAAAPRLKSYLAQRSTVNRMRDLLLRRNKAIREFDARWKLIGKTFFESLPELPSDDK